MGVSMGVSMGVRAWACMGVSKGVSVGQSMRQIDHGLREYDSERRLVGVKVGWGSV